MYRYIVYLAVEDEHDTINPFEFDMNQKLPPILGGLPWKRTYELRGVTILSSATLTYSVKISVSRSGSEADVVDLIALIREGQGGGVETGEGGELRQLKRRRKRPRSL